MTNFDYKKKKNQDADAIEQGSNRRSEVNREEESTWTSTQPPILHISD